MKINLNLGGLALLTILFIGCENKKITITQSRPLSSIELKGKAVYLSNCIACHNPDPNKPGSIGPDVASSSLELITARITKAKYPEGYKPKRESQMMPALPHLKKDIPAIHAYLNSILPNQTVD